MLTDTASADVPASTHATIQQGAFSHASGRRDPDVRGPSHPAVAKLCTKSGTNGQNITGTAFQPEAGTLAWNDGSVNVTLAEFTWITNRTDIDEVWPYWADHVPYGGGNGTPDFFGTLRLEVTAVPEPGVVLLLLTGAAGAVIRRARR